MSHPGDMNYEQPRRADPRTESHGSVLDYCGHRRTLVLGEPGETSPRRRRKAARQRRELKRNLSYPRRRISLDSSQFKMSFVWKAIFSSTDESRMADQGRKVYVDCGRAGLMDQTNLRWPSATRYSTRLHGRVYTGKCAWSSSNTGRCLHF